jgi:asparagine synthase (glutamine-hydrolysing)
MIKPTVNLLKLKNERILRGANAISINDEIERFLSVYEIFSESEIEELISSKDTLSKERITKFYKALSCEKIVHPVEKMMAIDTRMNLSDDLLNYTDKITMNFSIECRVPMLDIKLVNFIESLPVHIKLNNKGGKIIHKEFAKSILPDEIINRPKKGFQSPTRKWFKDEMDTLKDILLVEGSIFSSIFNIKAVEKILKQHINGFNKEKQIFLLLSIYYWMKVNDDLF